MDTLRTFINIPDISVFILLIIGILGGLRRGLSGELLRLITIIIAVVVGWKGADRAAEWLASRTDWPVDDLTAVAFFGLIISTYLVVSIIRHALRLLLDFTFQGKIERIGGALLGLTRATVFCSAVLLGAALIPSEPVQTAVQSSVTGRLVATHLVPLYENWADENPKFKLPELEKIKDIQVEAPPWDDYLGPLIETTEDAAEETLEEVEDEQPELP